MRGGVLGVSVAVAVVLVVVGDAVLVGECRVVPRPRETEPDIIAEARLGGFRDEDGVVKMSLESFSGAGFLFIPPNAPPLPASMSS